MACNSLQMRRSIGGATDGRADLDGILETLAGQDVRGLQILVRHFHDAFAGLIGHRHAFLERGGDGGVASKRHAQGFGHRVHSAGRAHCIAMPQRGGRGADAVHEFIVPDFAFGQQAAALPNHSAGTDSAAFMVAVQHRTTVKADCRDIHSASGHQLRGCSLVTPCSQNNRINRIAVQQFYQP